MTYYNGTSWVTETTAADVAQFRGRQQYGYYVQSQANTTYVDIDFVGGVVRDRVVVLTDAADGGWNGSDVYRFAETTGWSLDLGASIQSDLGFPRVVTSVVDDGVGAVATDEQHAHAGCLLADSIGKIAPRKASGHHHVGDQQLERGASVEDRQSGRSVLGLGYRVAQLAEGRPRRQAEPEGQ